MLLFVSLAGCVSGDYTNDDALSSALNTVEMEKNIHELINVYRIATGLDELEFDEELATIARLHSKDMAEKGYFSHYDLSGNGFEYRYQQANYNCTNSSYIGAENLFQNNSIESTTYINGIPFPEYSTQQEIETTTVEGWMDSPGHRDNILIQSWKKEGIGIYIASNGDILITQNFC